MVRASIVLLFLVMTVEAFAASCCGYTASSYTVLSQDQAFNMSTSYSVTETEGRFIDGQGFYVWDDRERSIESLSFNLARQFFQRHQVFVESSLMKGSYSDTQSKQSQANWSDTLMGYTYELLPEYYYSIWKPIIYVSLLVNLPTGKSIYDSSQISEGAGVTGYNQWGTGLGFTFRKTYYPLVLNLQLKVLQIQAKGFVRGLKVSNFYDASFSFMASYLTPIYGIGVNGGVTWQNVSQRRVSIVDEPTSVIQTNTLLFGVQKMFQILFLWVCPI